MGYFPFFIDIKNQKGLLVGGGKVAVHKVEKLLPFEPILTVIAPKIDERLLENQKLSCFQREFQDEDIEGAAFVIAASNQEELNKHISELCHQKGILVNVVDDKERCGFLFPALVREGALTVGISTEGASPQVAANIRSEIAAGVPNRIEEILDYLAQLRILAKAKIQSSEIRAAFLKETADFCMEQNCVLTEEETLERIRQYQCKEQAEKNVAGVTLVGAGCGAYDLITVRGMQALRHAQILIYDDLIDERLLSYVSESCEKIYVGKRNGKHSMKQEEINALLVEKAKTGKRVVRLKGGDPFVFGRGGEEMLALKQEKIPVKEVPGISSSIAVPAAAGIPVTHRRLSQSFHVITGHTVVTEDGLPKDMEALAALQGTLIFLMGFTHLRTITERLLACGKSPDTPAAVVHGMFQKEVIEKGVAKYPEAVAIRGTLADIAKKVENTTIPMPAIIIIGETAGMELLEE